jgi:hypothetical protein
MGIIDPWIERYLRFVDSEIKDLKAGAIGRHYRDCAAVFYREFQMSRNAADRFRAWLAIRTACQWLAQLEKGAS